MDLPEDSNTTMIPLHITSWTPINPTSLPHIDARHCLTPAGSYVEEIASQYRSTHHHAVLQAATRLVIQYHHKGKRRRICNANSVTDATQEEGTTATQEHLPRSLPAIQNHNQSNRGEELILATRDAQSCNNIMPALHSSMDAPVRQFNSSTRTSPTKTSTSTAQGLQDIVTTKFEDVKKDNFNTMETHVTQCSHENPESILPTKASTTIRQKQYDSPGFSSQPRCHTDKSRQSITSETACQQFENHSISACTVMKPFVRRPASPIEWDRNKSAIPLLTPTMRIPTCFRIADLLHLLNNKTSSPVPFAVELFAMTTGNYSTPGLPNPLLLFSDIFFPQKPPYVIGNMSDPFLEDQMTDISQQVIEADECLVRAVVRPLRRLPSEYTPQLLSPYAGLQSGTKAHVQIVHIHRCDWEEIRYTRGIVEPAA